MKPLKITYWTTTALLVAMMTFSAYASLTQPEMKQAFAHLGFPDYFRVELSVFKLLGVVVLLAPLASRLKEWAYAGFAITFVSAFVAHAAVGDPVSNLLSPIIALVLLTVSYLTYHKRSTAVRQPGILAHPKVALQG
jgi:putative copper export protein